MTATGEATASDGPRHQEYAVSRRLAAEAIGTFALVFVAVGGDAMADLAGGAIGPAARAIAPALMVGALIYAIGDVSGAHFNPVVTAAFALKRVFPVSLVPIYWVAQLVGGLTAAVVNAWFFGGAAATGVSSPHLVDPGTAVGIETLLTALLLIVILGTADRARIVGPNAAIAVAGTIALAGLIALLVEGASMNPTRSLAPAIVTGRLDDVWIYVAAPSSAGCSPSASTSTCTGATPRIRRPAARPRASPDRLPGGQFGWSNR